MKRNSRWPGFYRMDLAARRQQAARALELDDDEFAVAFERGGLEIEEADNIVENVLGTFALPFALALNFRVNGADYLVPMVVEEPSVVAAASNAAKMVHASGGFWAEADDPLMIGQVQLEGVPDSAAATEAILQRQDELLAAGNDAVSELVRFGGGVRGVEVRDMGQGHVVVHLLVDCRDAMGANLVNTVCERLSARLAELSGGRVGLRILSNLCDRRKVRVTARVAVAALAGQGFSGEEVRDRVVQASRFAERDPYRAVTHNKGIMNGVDAVALATGNDWRAVEAGAHAFACRDGSYRPLCTWDVDQEGHLEGRLEIPLALGMVGGSARVHRGVGMALRILRVETASELAMIVGAAGVASNLAALRALATEGIQRGHMSLHARSVAIAAGAAADDVERVAQQMRSMRQIDLESARKLLEDLDSHKK